jgi:hypothetical protein
MSPLVVIYVALHVVLFVTIGWLLILPQSFVYRCALGVVWTGALWNMAGLIWLGYNTVWPGEPFITAGICLVFLILVFSQKPLVTRRTLG